VDAAERANVTVRSVPALAGFQVIRGGEDDIGGLWTAVDRRPLQQAVARFRFHALLITIGALAACVAGTLIAAPALVRPFEELTGTLAALARGEPHTRHPVAGPEEVQRVARHVNRVAEQLERSKDRNVEEKARHLEQHNRLLQQIGRQDLLTGLPNRMGLEEEMGKYISLCKRSGQPLAVIMLDLDGFKAYNDTLGHTAGDKALCTAAAALKGRARASDVVVRWGGDEFCILIPFTTAERSLVAAEGFITAVAEATRDLARPETGAVLGASAGVACFPEDGDEGPELINRADAALYRAKAAGKGRVFRASSPQPEARA
jgi:diguanylate cyclase (GGDEF)-like protein